MNAPTDHAHLAPQLQLREVPPALIEALQAEGVVSLPDPTGHCKVLKKEGGR